MSERVRVCPSCFVVEIGFEGPAGPLYGVLVLRFCLDDRVLTPTTSFEGATVSPFDEFLDRVTLRLDGISCLAPAVACCRSSSGTEGLHHSTRMLYGRAIISSKKSPSVDTRSNDQSRVETYGLISGRKTCRYKGSAPYQNVVSRERPRM